MEATINDVMFGQSSPVSDLCSFQSPGSSNKRLGATARETIFQLYDPSLAIFPQRKHAAPSRSTIEPRDSARENQIDPHSEHHIYTKTHTHMPIYICIYKCMHRLANYRISLYYSDIPLFIAQIAASILFWTITLHN